MPQCLKEGRGEKKKDCPIWPPWNKQMLVWGLYFPFMLSLHFYYENFQIYSKVYRVVQEATMYP